MISDDVTGGCEISVYEIQCQKPDGTNFIKMLKEDQVEEISDNLEGCKARIVHQVPGVADFEKKTGFSDQTFEVNATQIVVTATETVSISVLSLMVWGSPGSFGVEDKELRMAAIGDFIAGDSDHDVFLLNDVRT